MKPLTSPLVLLFLLIPELIVLYGIVSVGFWKDCCNVCGILMQNSLTSCKHNSLTLVHGERKKKKKVDITEYS